MMKVFIKHFIQFILLVLIDQISKYLIRLKGGFYICNQGISFGIKLPDFIFWILWIAIILFLLFSLYKKCFSKYTWAVVLILAGAITNIIDRLYIGCVIDFIDLKIWPVFNFADIFISIGAIWIIFKNFKK